MKKLLQYPLVFVILFLHLDLSAQKNVFNIGMVAGANVAQIGTYDPQPLDTNSEEFFQKTHHGLNTGLLATMQITEHSQLGVEFLFSQNGKYVNSDPIYENKEADIFINYLEIPIHYSWQSNISRRKDFNNFNFQAGIAYARLLSGSSTFLKSKINGNPDFFKKDRTLLLQSGMTFFVTAKSGLNFRASLPADTQWTGMTFAARWVYLFRD